MEKQERIRVAKETVRLVTGEDARLTSLTKAARDATKLVTGSKQFKIINERFFNDIDKTSMRFDQLHETEEEKMRCAYVCTCEWSEEEEEEEERPIRTKYTPVIKECDISVTQETTLQAAARLSSAPGVIGVLNFASASHPGGGFLTGSQAQEESLARSSGLYPCLTAPQCKSFYTDREPLWYSNDIIVSPGVPVFRNDDGSMLAEPYLVTVLTCAAPNVRGMKPAQTRKHDLCNVLERRTECILSAAVEAHVDTLVLGAWGCGVFGQDPVEIARCFKLALFTKGYRKYFKAVVFAIPHDCASELAWPFYQTFA